MTEAKSKARQKFLPIQSPSEEQTHTVSERQDWIENLCGGFVQPSSANKAYYKVVVEVLWPKMHGIPGPHISEDKIREAIDRFRHDNKFGNNPDKPYVDVFRRVRELQGEEGLVGVARKGKIFQLVDLNIGPKRVPRTRLSESDWGQIKEIYDHKCAACKRKEPEVRFQQDHKIPRTRGGRDGIGNWQPLCDECNNFKSVSCRACDLDCNVCCWAFPELFTPIILKPNTLEKIYTFCSKNNLDVMSFVEDTLLGEIENE